MPFDFLRNRRLRAAERMDDDHADPAELRRSLAFIRRVNRFLGYARSVVAHVDRLTRGWPAHRPLEILDLATGSADIPRAILAWADRRGHDVRITAVDRHPVTVAEARAAGPADGRLTILQADVFALPFADCSFDLVMSAMFLHHLDEAGIVEVLRTMSRLARHGILAADLLRARRAYLWIGAFTTFSTPMVRHDARASVAQALTAAEVMDLARRAALCRPQLHRGFAHRFILTARAGLAGALPADNGPSAGR